MSTPSKGNDNLDKVVIGKLPNNITNALSKMELEVSDVQEWAESRPHFMVSVNEGHLDVFIQWHIPIKRFLFVIGGIFSLFVFVVNFRDEILFILGTLTNP